MARITQWRPTRTGIIFLIVTLILAVVVFGAIRLVQYRGEQVRQQEAAKIAQQNLEESSNTPVIAEDPSPSSEADQSDPNASGATPQPDVDVLPNTGTDEVPIMIGVIGLAFASAYYISSRRTLQRL